MAPIRSNNSSASFFDFFSKSGTDASDPYDPTNVKATGGTVAEPGNGYVYHVFTAPDTIVATGADVNDVDWLVVAGGGAGGGYFGGGGGAGGYRVRSPNAGPLKSPTAITISSSPISITVGNGASSNNAQGADSAFGPIASEGGGGGETGGGGGGAGTTGGSGGGGGPTNGGGTHPGTAGNTPPTSPPQGNPGGTGYHLGTYPSGGGGGAGGTGGSAGNNSGPGGPGGNGYPNPDFAAPHITPALTEAGVPSPEITAFTSAVGPTGLYAGGGGGIAGPENGAAGPGGGGAGGSPGVNYTGGGGGGQHPPGGNHVRTGGKGIVIIRYAV
tara:strand:+ start:574 stop:1557 length:984 start_codon:yes stop_codon:yes gene_type:complete